MSGYRKPVIVRADDPLCAVSALNGVVIGVLFEKGGKDIKEAIVKRVSVIDGRIGECEGAIGNVRTFLDAKERQITELEQFTEERNELRRAALRPMEREIEQVVDRMRAAGFDHNRETEALLAKKAAAFDDKFDSFKDAFRGIDDFLKEAHDAELVALMGNHGPEGFAGVHGCQGSQGPYHGGHLAHPGVYAMRVQEEISKDEDRSLARLDGLKEVVRTYAARVDKIFGMIGSLKEEKRRLVLIERNVDPARTYKLDLNKLSAFGFEDVEVTA